MKAPKSLMVECRGPRPGQALITSSANTSCYDWEDCGRRCYTAACVDGAICHQSMAIAQQRQRALFTQLAILCPNASFRDRMKTSAARGASGGASRTPLRTSARPVCANHVEAVSISTDMLARSQHRAQQEACPVELAENRTEARRPPTEIEASVRKSECARRLDASTLQSPTKRRERGHRADLRTQRARRFVLEFLGIAHSKACPAWRTRCPDFCGSSSLGESSAS